MFRIIYGLHLASPHLVAFIIREMPFIQLLVLVRPPLDALLHAPPRLKQIVNEVSYFDDDIDGRKSVGEFIAEKLLHYKAEVATAAGPMAALSSTGLSYSRTLDCDVQVLLVRCASSYYYFYYCSSIVRAFVLIIHSYCIHSLHSIFRFQPS